MTATINETAREQLEAKLKEAQARFPFIGLTFGYIGNCGLNYDDRAWYFFTTVAHESSTPYSEAHKLGGYITDQLPQFALRVQDKSFDQWLARVNGQRKSKFHCAECGQAAVKLSEVCMCERKGKLARIEKMLRLDQVSAELSAIRKATKDWTATLDLEYERDGLLAWFVEDAVVDQVFEERVKVLREFNPQVTDRQVDMARKLVQRIFKHDSYGNPFRYEFKKLELKASDHGALYLVTEVGGRRDEGTVASILCRNRRHIAIGKRGGVTLINAKEKRHTHGLFHAVNSLTN